MLKDGQLFCDRCGAPITHVSDAPPEGWPSMHNLCSKCFAEVKATAIPRPAI